MVYSYPAIFAEEADGAVSVIFPDFNETATFGDDLEDAMMMANDCMACCITGYIEDGMELPTPTPIDQIDSEAIICGIDNTLEDDEGKLPEYKRVWVDNVTLDVDKYAEENWEQIDISDMEESSNDNENAEFE